MNLPAKRTAQKLFRVYRESRVRLKVAFEKAGLTLLRRNLTPDQTIILAGSGRSGTTWILNTLGDLLGYQTLFEPLNPNFISQAKQLLGIDPAGDPVVFSPYLRTGDQYPDWSAYLSSALSGRVRNQWTDKNRFTLLPQGYIAKFIRANLMLGYLHDNFGSRIIFIMRHPCAVIYSRLQLNWKADKQDLLSQEDLVEDHLRPFLPDIESERDPVGVHAIWWAVEQFVALETLKRQDHFFAHYEDIYLSPEQWFPEIISWLDLPGRKENNSQMKGAGDDARTELTRISKWVSGLRPEEQEKILWWANRFGIQHYTNHIYPVRKRD